jgi:hypothetical protein
MITKQFTYRCGAPVENDKKGKLTEFKYFLFLELLCEKMTSAPSRAKSNCQDNVKTLS